MEEIKRNYTKLHSGRSFCVRKGNHFLNGLINLHKTKNNCLRSKDLSDLFGYHSNNKQYNSKNEIDILRKNMLSESTIT